jgi:VWFA-related protein
MIHIRARLALTCACAVVSIVSPAARPQSTQQPPQFKSGVDLVTLDLSAMTADGTPIRDLRADEIRISVGGQPRTLKSFAFVEVAPLRVPAKGAATAARAPMATATNAASSAGRSVFVVVLHEHIRPGNEHIAMEGVRRVIDQLEPRDRVAIVTMPFGRVEVDLTADHDRAKKRLYQVVGHADVQVSVPTGTTTTSEALDLLEFLKSITPLDGPKTVLLISEGFQTGEGPFDAGDRVDVGAALLDRPETTAVAPLLNDMGQIRGEVNDLRTAAAAARAQFYVIQPHNFAVDPGFKARGQERVDLASVDRDRYTTMGSQTRALAGLAAVVGGRFLQLSGKSEPIFDRIVRETSGYYALAFETEPQDRDDKARSVDVSTTRPGVTLRARRTFLDKAAAGVKTSGPASVPALLNDAVSHSDVPLRALAFTTRAANGEVRVMALAQSLGPELKEAGFALVNAKNTVVASWPADLSAGAAPLVSAKVVASGHYRLRAAAIDANGAGGAVDYEFDATLAAAGPFRASSLMAGVQQGTSFKPRLSFTPGDDLVPYFELYGTGDVEILFELARPDGAAVARSPGSLTPTRDADRRIVSASLPLGSVPAGDYVLRAVLRTGSTAAGTLELKLTVTP